MELRFVGIDPDTGKEGSPTVWVDEQTGELVIQGWEADPATLQAITSKAWVDGHSAGVPEGEAVIRVPARMAQILREACNVVDGDEVR